MFLILGQGYSGGYLARSAKALGHEVVGVRTSASPGILAADDPQIPQLIGRAEYIVSSAPPEAVGDGGHDPVLSRFSDALRASKAWIGYLSSTGVYGDSGGAWLDESAEVGSGRRSLRTSADLAWQELGATIFRLPGIYGPGRSVFDQLQAGTARRIDRPGHRFNRVHVVDIAGAVLAASQIKAGGIFNVVDHLPAEPRQITEYACALSGLPLPPLQSLDLASLPPMARLFWTEQRCTSGSRLHRETGYRMRYPDYKAGLTGIWRGADRQGAKP